MKEKILCTLVDDESEDLSVLKFDLESLGLKVERVFGDPEQFMLEVRKLKSRVFFLDINMPGLDGFQCAEQLKGKKVIFVSASTALGYKAYDFDHVIDFVPKPVSKARLSKAVDKLLEDFNHDAGILYLKFEKNEYRIHRDKIVAITTQKSTGNKVLIVADPVEIIKASDIKFDDLMSQIDHPDFIRIGRSDVINLKYLRRKISSEEIEMKIEDPFNVQKKDKPDLLTFQIGPGYRQDFDSQF